MKKHSISVLEKIARQWDAGEVPAGVLRNVETRREVPAGVLARRIIRARRGNPVLPQAALSSLRLLDMRRR
jgi:hypothetical protein